MLIHREPWKYSGQTPAFFTGQGGCYCCASPLRKINSFFGTTTGAANIATNSQFDYSTTSWAAKTAGANAQSGRVSGSFFDGIVYLASGAYFASGAWQCKTDKYVDASDSWTALTDVPSPQRWNASAVATNRMYLFSGESISGDSIPNVSEYDQSANSWSGKTDLPGGGRSRTVAFTNGTVSNCAGGLNQLAGPGSATYRAENYQYDHSANSWSTKTALTNPLFQAGSFSLGNFGYTIGGVRVISGTLARTGHWQRYDFSTDSWSVFPTSSFALPSEYPIQNESMGTATNPGASVGSTFGGSDGGALRSSSHYQFTPTVWVNQTPLPSQPRSHNTGGTC